MKIEFSYDRYNDRWRGERLKFKETADGNWMIINSEEQLLGYIDKLRCGRFMHWCLLLNQDCYLTPGCNDEVRAFQRKCYSLEKTSQLNSKENLK